MSGVRYNNNFTSSLLYEIFFSRIQTKRLELLIVSVTSRHQFLLHVFSTRQDSWFFSFVTVVRSHIGDSHWRSVLVKEEGDDYNDVD